MKTEILEKAIDKLGNNFEKIEWKYLKNDSDTDNRIQLWPGRSHEDVMICVYKGREYLETFHRQNFFFFNFAYKGDYNAFSYLSNNNITVHEDECYIGQPYAGYSIHDKSEEEKIIVGVLIQTEAFFKTFFNVLSSDKHLFEFFLNPQINEFSEEYIQLKFEDSFSVRSLLNLMIVEYSNPKEDTQDILRPLTLALLMEVSREYKKSAPQEKVFSLVEQIVNYINENYNHCSLNEIANHFSYHPNYVSALLSKELGKTFSEILLEQRMERAVALMNGTNLPISDIAELLGYSNNSNFYKAFREYYHISPREYMRKLK